MSNQFTPVKYPYLFNPDRTIVWINVPKCGSSFMQKVFHDFGWSEYKYHHALLKTDMDKIIVLRDPVERWISGFSEYALDHPWIWEQIDNDYIWELILSNPVFDDHTQFQHQFVADCNIDNLCYVYMQDNPKRFYSALENWCNIFAMPIPHARQSRFMHWTEKQNPAQNDTIRWHVNQKIRNKLQEDKTKRVKIRELHKQDYKFMDSIRKIDVTN